MGLANSTALDLVALPDGDIVAAGRAENAVGDSEFALVRYNPDGSLNQSFGVGGKVTTGIAQGALVLGLVALPSGDLVVAGRVNQNASGTNSDFALARYNQDGLLDNNFGLNGSGVVVTRVGDGDTAQASDLDVLPDGRLLATGTAKNAGAQRFALVRYNSNGSLDSTFGSGGNGRVITSLGDGGNAEAKSAAVLPNRDVVAVGRARDQAGATSFTTVRYNADGSLDESFGSNGSVMTTNLNSVDGKQAIRGFALSTTVLPDGDIVAAGSATFIDPFETAFALVRYDEGGSPSSGGGDSSSGGGAAGSGVNLVPAAQCFAFSGTVATAKSRRVTIAKKVKASLTLTQPRLAVRSNGTLPVRVVAVGGKQGAKRLAKVIKQAVFTVNGKAVGKDKNAPFTASVKQSSLKIGVNNLQVKLKLKRGKKQRTVKLRVPIQSLDCP